MRFKNLVICDPSASVISLLLVFVFSNEDGNTEITKALRPQRKKWFVHRLRRLRLSQLVSMTFCDLCVTCFRLCFKVLCHSHRASARCLARGDQRNRFNAIHILE
jgi:hypothetical protein